MVIGVPDARTVTIWIQLQMTGHIIAICVQHPVLLVMDMRTVWGATPAIMDLFAKVNARAAMVAFVIRILVAAHMAASVVITRQ